MPITLNLQVTLDDATLAAIRGDAPAVVVPSVTVSTIPTNPVVTHPAVETPSTQAPLVFYPPVANNGTPANNDPALARVNTAPGMWAIYSNDFLSSPESGPLVALIGHAELGRRLQHYFYVNPVKGYAEQVDGRWQYQYQPTGTDQWLPWSGPGDPPGQVPYGYTE